MNVECERCLGCELFTKDGRRILDFLSGYCATPSDHLGMSGIEFSPPKSWQCVRAVRSFSSRSSRNVRTDHGPAHVS
jgi:hypothetical protein